jgi:hypothetical protein
MRAPRPLARPAVATAAAVLLLSGCGGDDDAGAFCDQARDLQARLSVLEDTDPSDPEAFVEALRTAADRIRDVDAPDEIADDWTTLADGFDEVAGIFEGVDLSDPEALATIEEQFGALEGDITASSERVETHLQDECGIDAA